jgi:hypothetical protein
MKLISWAGSRAFWRADLDNRMQPVRPFRGGCVVQSIL